MSDSEDKPTVRAISPTDLKYGEGSKWSVTRRRYFKEFNGTTPVGSGAERKPLVTVAEPLPALKPKVTIHEERSFTFADGSVARCCPVENCLWGQPTKNKQAWRKKHSTGLEVVIPEVEPTEDGEGVEEIQEVSTDDITELSVEGILAAANDGLELPEQEQGEHEQGDVDGDDTQEEAGDE